MALIQLRRGTAAEWTAANPILAAGEPGLELDTLRFKIGSGSTHWNDLEYELGGFPQAISADFRFLDTTIEGDPGSGRLALDNAAQLSATTIRVSFFDKNSANVMDFISAMGESSSTVKGFIRLYKTNEPSRWILFKLFAIDIQDGWYDLSVAVVAGSGTNPFVNFNLITLAFDRTGDKGDDGTDGVDGTDGDPGPPGTVMPGDATPAFRWLSEQPIATGLHKRFYPRRAGYLQSCALGVEDADGNATAQVDVLVSGSSIYTTATKPDCDAGDYIGVNRVPDDDTPFSFTEDDYFEIQVLNTGGTQGRLSLIINFTYAGI